MKPALSPWQVWWADFDPQADSEQGGRRPAIIVGTEIACQLLNDMAIVVPCSTRDRNLAVQPRINLAGTPSVAMCDQVKAVSTDRLHNLHDSELTTEEVEQIRDVLRRLISV